MPVGSESADEVSRRELPEEDDVLLIRNELARVLKSRYFCRSRRSCEFLQFVVEQKISGNADALKERLIGIQLLGRKVDYVTGDDPAVRVQAGEVRRRLELYQTDADGSHRVAIFLPSGSYVPVFVRSSQPSPVLLDESAESSPLYAAGASRTVPVPVLPPPVVEAGATRHGSKSDTVLPMLEYQPAAVKHSPAERRAVRWALGAAALLLLLAGSWFGGSVWWHRNQDRPAGWMTAFWGPIDASSRPVLVCLGRPLVYAPGTRLWDQYSAAHAGALSSIFDRRNKRLPIDAGTPVRWGDLDALTNAGPATGGVRAAMDVASLLGSRAIPFTVRFGDEANFDDFRDAPAINIGSLNSEWILLDSRQLHFSLQQNNGVLAVQEKGSEARWQITKNATGSRDYALITREIAGPGGNFFVNVQGISDGGTEAAAALLCNAEALRAALKKLQLPAGWEHRNLQIVLATNKIGGKAGPPEVVAWYAWQ